MPLNLEIIRATEFVRVGAEGQFNLAASKAALAVVARACRKRGIQHAILDLRALQPGPKPVFSPADLLELVRTFPAVGFTNKLRLAILYRSDPHRRARLFAFLSSLHGWKVRAFSDFEATLAWMSERDEAPSLPRPTGSEEAFPLPVRRAGSAVPAPAAGRRRTPRRSVGSARARPRAGQPSGAGFQSGRGVNPRLAKPLAGNRK
jgi:hypothetical protein